MPVGVLPMSLIQDVLVGIETPVMKSVKSTKLRADTCFSIVCTNRTLDLQVDSIGQRDEWVSAIKTRFKMYMQEHGVVESDHDPHVQDVPKAWQKKMKIYSAKFRSESCALKIHCMKLQNVRALSRELSRKDEADWSKQPPEIAEGALHCRFLFAAQDHVNLTLKGAPGKVQCSIHPRSQR